MKMALGKQKIDDKVSDKVQINRVDKWTELADLKFKRKFMVDKLQTLNNKRKANKLHTKILKLSRQIDDLRAELS